MKIFSIVESPHEEFVKFFSRKHGFDEFDFLTYKHPQEDFALVSDKLPVFAVADGVTLIQYLIDKKIYPNPSPAGDLAKAFCEGCIEFGEQRYESFIEGDIQEMFGAGNLAAEQYNRESGRTKETVDFWNNDFYAATAAFGVLKDNIFYWGSICDSYIVHFRNGKFLFKSPKCHLKQEADGPVFIGNSDDIKAKTIYTWSKKRNGVNNDDKLIGYGVVTGEGVAMRYLNFGKINVQKDDLIVLLTDGFENYLDLREFFDILNNNNDNIEKHLKEFTEKMSKENPDKYGHERTLIAVRT